MSTVLEPALALYALVFPRRGGYTYTYCARWRELHACTPSPFSKRRRIVVAHRVSSCARDMAIMAHDVYLAG